MLKNTLAIAVRYALEEEKWKICIEPLDEWNCKMATSMATPVAFWQ